jgi:hypothetical protein
MTVKYENEKIAENASLLVLNASIAAHYLTKEDDNVDL